MPIDRTTGTRRPGVTKSQVPDMRIDRMEDLILKNRKKLQKHSDKRHTSVRVLDSPSSTAGVEGELATDGSAMWIYLNGAWQETICSGTPGGPPVIIDGEIVICIRPDDAFPDSVVHLLDPDIPDSSEVMPALTPWYWFSGWLNADSSKVFAESSLDNGRAVHKVNDDGSSFVEIFNHLPFSNGVCAFTRIPGQERFAVLNRNVPRTIVEYDINGDSEIVWNPTIHAVGVYDRPGVLSYNSDGTKFAMNLGRSSGQETRYVFDKASGVSTLINLVHVPGSFCPMFNPTNDSQLGMKTFSSSFVDGMTLIASDGLSDQTDIYFCDSNDFDLDDNWRFSPDGTMIAFFEYNFVTDPATCVVKVIDISGEIIGEAPVDEENADIWCWAPSSSKIAVAFTANYVSIIDVPEMTVTEVTVPFSRVWDIEWGNTNVFQF